MKLYHGTNADIETIDLSQGLRHKDFGQGFYATPDKTTAIRMAKKKEYEQPLTSPDSHIPHQLCIERVG